MNDQANMAVGRQFPADKMFLFLKGKLMGAKMDEALRALYYMREHHAGQCRDDGQPYEVHPMMMACYAVSLDSPYVTDDTIAVILLHDVCEESWAQVNELPFNVTIRRGVKYMTLTRFRNETKFEHKKRYMNELLESWDATVAKAIDRYFNLMTMQAVFSPDKVRKNVVETDMLLLPVLKEAKRKWPERSGVLWVLRTAVRSVNDNLAMSLGVRLTDEDFINSPEAVDYSYLLTGAANP